jgi:hypothetical protein
VERERERDWYRDRVRENPDAPIERDRDRDRDRVGAGGARSAGDASGTAAVRGREVGRIAESESESAGSRGGKGEYI